ncbi:hypothetical protein [Streptomyces sp. 8K308]|nr:hypothetical protein [Streptomyces sp. 8K308]
MVDERRVSYLWHLLPEAWLLEELADAGLTAPADPPPGWGVYVVTRENSG